MQSQLEKIRNYIFIKWLLIFACAVVVTIEFLMHTTSPTATAATYLSLLFLALVNIWITLAIKRQALPVWLLFLALGLDLFIILLSIYFNGGMENTWLFIPVLVIFLTGYLLNLGYSLLFAAVSFLGIMLIYAMENTNLIPHYNIYGIPVPYWTNLSYLKDYFSGMFFLYFISAFASGYLNQLMSGYAKKLENSLAESEEARSELETSRKAMLNVMDDLENARSELDQRVKARTAELEEAKSNLEQKVSDRTADLEASRKAIMHMMKDLKEDVTKLQAVDRMKTEFLSLVSHELRTPLTPIKGYLYLILNGKMGEISPTIRTALEIIRRQSEHLHSMIDNILDISRFELGKSIPLQEETLSIKQIIEETCEAAIIQARQKRVNLVMEIQSDLPMTVGDSVKLKRVVINLVGNAIKFTSEGGETKIRAFSEGNNIRVEVSDNGIGIEKENLEKIFEKFYQVDSSATRATGGIGMGLTICKELIALHGGQIWAESEGLGKGSKFIFTLPVKKEGG
jgi:signal transduction histidine kinase